MPLETTRERLARLYPQHFQTILERMYEAWNDSITDQMLSAHAPRYVLASAFAWDMTEEGRLYWSTMSSRVEGDVS